MRGAPAHCSPRARTVIRRAARDVTDPDAVAVLQIFRPPVTTCPEPAGNERVSASTVTGAAVAVEAPSRRALMAVASEIFTPAHVGRALRGLERLCQITLPRSDRAP